MATRYYTTQEAADRAGVHKNTVLNWIKTGKMPDVRRDWKRYRLWTEKDLEKLLEVKNRYVQLNLEIKE